MKLTDSDLEFIATADEETLRIELAYARASNDSTYASALAREILKRRNSIAGAA